MRTIRILSVFLVFFLFLKTKNNFKKQALILFSLIFFSFQISSKSNVVSLVDKSHKLEKKIRKPAEAEGSGFEVDMRRSDTLKKAQGLFLWA